MKQQRKRNSQKHKDDMSKEGENIPYAGIDFSRKGKDIKQNRNTALFQRFPRNSDQAGRPDSVLMISF